MIDLFRKLFPNPINDEQALSQDELHITAIALMQAIARADSAIDDTELQAICNIAGRLWVQDEHQRTSLIEQAKQREASATSLHEFTSVIHEYFTPEQKFELVKGLWEVAYADGHLDRYEEHIIRRVADLIYVDHHEFIRAKHLASQKIKS